MENKRKNWIYLVILTGMVIIFPCSCEKDEKKDTVTDIDGNEYKTITIGTQVWMLENLRVTHYRGGEPIANITDAAAWANNMTTGAYCDYNNTPNNDVAYGKLYNGYAVFDSKNLAPEGWHVPTKADWTTLVNYLGGETIAGSKLKEAGTTHWPSPNTDATNESGFTALPNGYRGYDGIFYSIGSIATWWSATADNPSNPWSIDLMFYDNNARLTSFNVMRVGRAIRCIKD